MRNIINQFVYVDELKRDYGWWCLTSQRNSSDQIILLNDPKLIRRNFDAVECDSYSV